LDNWPRVIQLAFILTDTNFNEVTRFCQLIKPDGWVIPNEKFWIDNGYSTEINERDGYAMPEVLDLFVEMVNKSTHIFAHNMAFDHPVLGAEMMRYKKRAGHIPVKVCTMRESTSFCDIKNARGGIKWPKLEELHQVLFRENFDNAHDALADVSATVRCAKELHSLGVLSV
jgi:DNA polymerase III epsilon subunit-like protein